MKRSGFSHVRVQNYQSIHEADAPLGPLTVIVGDNFAGKSALLRAIEAACFNETGVGFISYGEAKTEVELTLSQRGEDTHLLRWRKKREGGATYDLFDIDSNGEVHADDAQHFSKLGASVPPEVRRALGIAEIDVDKTLSITPQVHKQGEFAFLIDRSEGQAARALAKMTKLDVVVEAQGLIRTDLRRTNADLKATADNIVDYERQMTEFTGLDEQVERVESLLKKVRDIEQRQQQVREQRRALDRCNDCATALHAIGPIPALDDITLLVEAYDQLADERAALMLWQKAHDALEDLPDELPDVSALVKQAAQFEQVERAAHDVAFATAALTAVENARPTIERDLASAVAAYNALGTCPECGQPLEKVAV